MAEFNIIKRIILGEKHKPTGKTRHFIHGGVPAPVPYELRIVHWQSQYGEGYYLYYCEETGEEFTDTFHDSLERAMHQAEYEFNVKPEEWEPWQEQTPF